MTLGWRGLGLGSGEVRIFTLSWHSWFLPENPLFLPWHECQLQTLTLKAPESPWSLNQLIHLQYSQSTKHSNPSLPCTCGGITFGLHEIENIYTISIESLKVSKSWEARLHPVLLTVSVSSVSKHEGIQRTKKSRETRETVTKAGATWPWY